jgi:hypothetical protein
MCAEWKKNYTGIDLSEKAVANARKLGIEAYVADIHCQNPRWSMDDGLMEYHYNAYELFLFLDSLEHIHHHVKLAEKVKQLAAEKFGIFGNVPLYHSVHAENEGIERPMNITLVARFLKKCGIDKFRHEVYGIHGWPYLWFEGYNR